ncbi:MAG TPA: ABC transporter permease [Candidatus Xenobia bacterium]|nr:ABC transporter permease [Candidatus Xenobia bacterium]
MGRIGAIALNTFRETVRERVLYNLIVFALLLIGTAILFGQISIGVQTLILINLGLTAITFFGLAIAIFIGIGLVYKEMDKRTLYALLSKPVRRYEFILGKFAGLGLTLLVNVALMTVGFYAALFYIRGASGPENFPSLVAIYFIFLQLLLATALALLFSCFSSPVLSAAFTFGLFIAGSFSTDLLALSKAVQAPWLEGVMRALYYALPNFRNFNISTGVAHGHGVPGVLVLHNTLYALLYTGLVVAAAVLIFQNRNLK